MSLSEINELDMGLTIELWSRGMLWDKLLGLHWLPLFYALNTPTRPKYEPNYILNF